MIPFTAKILLFGEFSIVIGGNGLAIPFPNYQGAFVQARMNVLKQSNIAESQASLLSFIAYLKTLKDTSIPNFDQAVVDFEKAVFSGLFFDSNIPQGYGLGSSAALIAAFYHAYIVPQKKHYSKEELLPLRRHFGLLESYFHGKSSGIDPLVSYVNQPLLIQADGALEPIELKEKRKDDDDGFFFLFDTHLERHTGPLVTNFVKRTQDPAYKRKCQKELNVYNAQCIQAVIAGNSLQLWDSMEQLSAFQLEYFQPMIPESIRPTWKEGLDNGKFRLKLCGAGGGGFMLGYARCREDIVNYESRITSYEF